MYQLIAFDADDTLWHNETLYHEILERFQTLLAGYVDSGMLEEALFQTEMRNLPYFGYGIKSYILSMVETAVEVTGGRVQAGELGQLVDFARDMVQAEVRLLENVRDTVAALAERYDLMVITKGDLMDQEAKLVRSGLHEYFRYFETVPDKDVRRYSALLARYGVPAEKFVMVGDSMRSDVLPVLELGGTAIYVPYPVRWAHEAVEPPADAHYHQLDHIGGLPALLDSLEQQNGE
ncbi:MAG TPA: HAD family hydrolase [Anaerolineaceae bacterium]